MDGRNFLYSNGTPPRIAFSTAFNFDLQRFDAITVNEGGTVPPTGAKFSVTDSNGTKYYGEASDFNTTNVGTATQITLLDNFTASETATISSSCTLDLNGKDLTLGYNYIWVNSQNATLTIKDSTATTEPTVSSDYKKVTYTAGKIEATGDVVVVQNNATVILESGQIKSTSNAGVACGDATVLGGGGYYSKTNNSANFIMNGGYINSQESGVFTTYESTAQINGGVIMSNDNGALMDQGMSGAAGNNGTTVNITGGTLIGNIKTPGYASCVVYRANKGVLNVTGGKLVSTNGGCIVTRSGNVNISGDAEIIAMGDGTTAGKVGDSRVVITTGDAIVYDTSAQYPGLENTNEINIDGGTITGQNASVTFLAKDSTSDDDINSLNITGGTLNGDINNKGGKKADGTNVSTGSGKINISGGQVNGDVNTDSKGKTAISGGTVKGDVNNTGEGETEISGGSVQKIVTNSKGSTKITGTAQINGNVEISGGTTEISGGTVKGNVTSTGTGTTTKITGGTVGGSVTSSNSASTKVTGGTVNNVAADLIENGYEKDANGNIIAKAAWVTTATADQYNYVIATDLSDSATHTIIAGATLTSGGDSSALKGDKLYKLLGVPSGTNFAFNSTDATVGYAAAEYSTTSATDITITPKTDGVKIIGTNFIGDTITKLTTSGSSGIAVDATNNKLTNITGGNGDDSLVAGTNGGTLDGGTGNDTLVGGSGNTSLKGGDGNDVFYYSAGNDTVNGFTSGDKVYVSGQTTFTDGSQISTVDDNNNFKITFSSGNSLTFINATNPIHVNDGTNNYYYTKDLVQQGTSVTLAAGLTQFNAGDSSQASLSTITAIDASAVTGDLTITDNAQNNYITFASNKATFNYKNGGHDTVEGYTYGTDVVSLAGENFTAPTDFTKATFDGSDFKITVGDSNTLTFTGKSNVALLKGNDTYTYKGHSNGYLDYIAQEGKGITLGAGHTSTQYNGTSTEYETIDASAVTQTIRIRGNDKNNYIVGNNHGGELLGYEGKDTITAGGGSTTLDGGAGNDLLIGSNVEGSYNQFVYSEGKDSIQNYQDGKDVIKVSGREVSFADATVSTAGNESADLLIQFDDANQLSIAGGATLENPISVTSGRNNYTFTKDYMALEGKGITLASGYSSQVGTTNTYDGSQSDYVTINAAAVNNAISVMGNSLNNYIFGPTAATSATLNGGSGNDRIDVSERSTTGDGVKYVFEHDAGKDEVFGFNQTNDSLKIAVESITAAKAGNSRLTLTIAKDNSIVLRGDDDITKVNLNEGNTTADYLTKDGYVKKESTSGTLTLFSSAKGRIELGDKPYSESNINAVNAEDVEKQSVTLVGGTQGGTFTYATGNKKRDGFVYGGGNVKIVNYEAGKDRIDLNAATFSSFTVDKDVVLAVGTGSISITGAAGQEVLLRNGGSRSFKKMVFAETGVLQNKSKNPTSATVSGAANNYTVDNSNASIKKIYVTGLAENHAEISIEAGNKNNTIIDASAAGKSISLSGGNKNDKLIGNTVAGVSDTFVYSAGKDIIQNFSADDTISLTAGTSTLAESLSSAKITAGSKSIKFKFSNKNTLTVKATKGESLSGALNIVSGETNTTNTYAKNAIADSTNKKVTLTDKFSGTFKTVGTKGLDGITVETVDGSKVTKNLTFKGSEANESLTGGKKKNTFKGGGGNDTLTGGKGAKDIFFYAKGDKGETTIADFEFGANKDRLKIASGTIGEIKKDGDNIQFAMNSGKKGDTSNIGWFNVEKTDTSKNVAIKANNTYYWFADGTETIGTGDDTLKINSGQLITSDTRVSSGDVSNFDILELNYSTNLAKSGVAVKVTGVTPTKTNG